MCAFHDRYTRPVTRFCPSRPGRDSTPPPLNTLAMTGSKPTAGGVAQPLPRFGLPTTCSTCGRESRSCRAMAPGFTPASYAARMSFA